MIGAPHPRVLAAALRRAGWFPDGANLAVASPDALLEADLSADPLTRLFEVGRPVGRDEIEAAWGRQACRDAIEAGLLSADGDTLRAERRLVRHTGENVPAVWVLADHDLDTRSGPIGAAHVSAVTAAAVTLGRLVDRTRSGSFLDLGCGSGIQVLWASGHAARIVATDVAERALELTRYNAALNGVDVDVRGGSLFEPVAGESFDTIVSNAPFVITPPAAGDRLVYRDSGYVLDAFARELVEGACAHLASGGRAYLLINWLIGEGETTTCAPERWLEGRGVDAWVVARDRMSPAAYATHWVRDAGMVGEEARERAREWAGWLHAEGVKAVAMGFVAIAKRPGGGIVRAESSYAGQPLPDGAHVEQVLDGIRQLAELGDDLADAAFDKRVRLVETRVYPSGGGEPTRVTLVPADPADACLGQRDVSGEAAGVIGACDGELTLGQLADAVATLTGSDPRVVLDDASEVAADLLARGMLKVDSAARR
ncbi:MAG: methyltransferase [Actinomycetaceae bacterium]|nr:methyltransferase [Actinomycetaceae bacterium]